MPRFITVLVALSLAVGCQAPATVTTPDTSCRPVALITGYWPPTNEMLRPWSTNPAQNPAGWQGANWRGLGYDVYAHFPEFPPDGDPTNDRIGDPGSVGAGDLPVDYQATSRDFWRLVDRYQPRILITTSRGGEIGWEIEAVEGGHGSDPMGDPALDWVSDRHGDVHQPTRASIDPRSWQIISTWRQGQTLATRLPVAAILAATRPLGLTRVDVDATGTSGNYLSGFMGLHGLGYQQGQPATVAAGHIHVGRDLPPQDAKALMEATLEAVLTTHPATCSQG